MDGFQAWAQYPTTGVTQFLGDEKQDPGLRGGYSFTGYEDVAAEESCVQSARHVSSILCAKRIHCYSKQHV